MQKAEVQLFFVLSFPFIFFFDTVDNLTLCAGAAPSMLAQMLGVYKSCSEKEFLAMLFKRLYND